MVMVMSAHKPEYGTASERRAIFQNLLIFERKKQKTMCGSFE